MIAYRALQDRVRDTCLGISRARGNDVGSCLEIALSDAASRLGMRPCLPVLNLARIDVRKRIRRAVSAAREVRHHRHEVGPDPPCGRARPDRSPAPVPPGVATVCSRPGPGVGTAVKAPLAPGMAAELERLERAPLGVLRPAGRTWVSDSTGPRARFSIPCSSTRLFPVCEMQARLAGYGLRFPAAVFPISRRHVRAARHRRRPDGCSQEQRTFSECDGEVEIDR